MPRERTAEIRDGLKLKITISNSPNNTWSAFVKAYELDYTEYPQWTRGVQDLPDYETAKEMVEVLKDCPDIVPGHRLLTM
jgi:hypothetical protein